MAALLHSHRYSSFLGVSLLVCWILAFGLHAQMEPQTTNSGTRLLFSIGPYKLDAAVHGFEGLIEFSNTEYAVMGRHFEGEINYNAPPVEFLGRRWDLQLGTVYGSIYKIAPYLEFRDRHEANQAALEILHYCTERLGTPSKQKSLNGRLDAGNAALDQASEAGPVSDAAYREIQRRGFFTPDTQNGGVKTDLFMWNAQDGNAVLQTAELQGSFSVSLFLTSRSVENFRLLGLSKPDDRPFTDVVEAAQDDRSFVEHEIRRWQQEVARNPKDYETLAAIGAAYGKLGEHATAVTYFKKAIEANPSYADAYAGLGSAYGFLRRPNEALAALRKAVSLDPTDPITQAQLGTTLGKAAQYQEAIVHLKEAVRLEPGLADAHFALGLAYVSTGDRKKAVDEVNTLSRLDSQQSARLQHLVDLSKQSGDKD